MKTAKEMFKKLGYEIPCYAKDHTIEYGKWQDDEFYGKTLANSVIFHKRIKKVKILGSFTIEEIQVINKQIKELGWDEN